MSDTKIHFADDTQLMGYGESDSSGAWIKFQIQSDDLAHFRGLKGTVFHMTLVKYLEDGTVESVSIPAQVETHEQRTDTLASRLHKNGYFNNPHLWDAMEASGIYTQDQHKAWIEKQGCMLAGHGAPCNGDIVGHHIRNAANAGTSIKPKHWYLIPVCDAHHRHDMHKTRTREQRESDLLRAVAYTAARMKQKMKEALNRESLSGITQEELDDFEILIGLKKAA